MNIVCKVGKFCFGSKSLNRACLSTVNSRLVQVVSMGLLTEGSPLSWEETKALAEHVRQHGVEQFIHLYGKLRERTGDVLKWGDEVHHPHSYNQHTQT